MGRPKGSTKYKPIYASKKVKEYLKTTGREQTHLPKIESFAIFLGVARKTLYNWEKEYPMFAEALDEIRTRQAEQLVDDGIYGGKEVNATIVKLLLQNNHGMRERSDVTSGDKPVPILGGNGISSNNSNKEAPKAK